MQLHVPYSEHAKAPVGPITMGLPLAMDPKKLGKDLRAPLPGRPRFGSSCPRWGEEGRQFGCWDHGLSLRGGWHSQIPGSAGPPPLGRIRWGPSLRVPVPVAGGSLPSPIPSTLQRSEAGAAVPTGPGWATGEPGSAHSPGDICAER